MGLKKKAKAFLYSHKFAQNIYNSICSSLNILRGGVQLIDHSTGKLKKTVLGKNNKVVLDKGTKINALSLLIRGNNNQVLIGNDCFFGTGCSICIEGNGCTVKIGDKSTFVYGVHLCAQEDGSEIVIGEDCMFSNTIIVRTSDSHPIYDMTTNARINSAANVFIGNHVWIAPNTKVFKGVKIGTGAIIGSDTLVTHDVSENTLAVGHPAKIVKEKVKWTRETLY